MREKSKTFRIDSRTRATSMIKFSARLSSKNFSHKNELPKSPFKFRNNFFFLLLSEDPDQCCQIFRILNTFYLSHYISAVS